MKLLPYFLALTALLCPSQILNAQGDRAPKQVPPPGVQIPDDARKELEAGVAELSAKIKNLHPVAHPGVPGDIVADVEIFAKAVDWALRYNEFYDAKQVGVAKALLAEGNSRATALASGQTPWLTATGPVVRGYRSRIDGSVQPYGLNVPSSWKGAADDHPRPLYIWNHGRSENLTELAFINERLKGKSDFLPNDTFVAHCYGRFCNATKFAGETDVLEVLAAVKKQYPIDERRIVMTGFSMGGASVWHLAAHHASLWVAASPGAGFAETPVYTKAFEPGKNAPPWWEQTLWRLYDATDYAANLADTTLVAYSGEIDPQKQSADIMEKAADAEGVKIERIIGPNTGHKYEPGAKKELDHRLDELVAKGRDEIPAKVRLVTYTLRYNRQDWVQVDGLEKHWDRADVTAETAGPDSLQATTKNVSAITFDIHGKSFPFAANKPVKVQIDGQDLKGAAPASSTWTASFVKTDGKWAPSTPASGLEKRHGLQGPIDDAFMDSFVFVRPTGQPLNPAIADWTKNELDRAIKQWRTVFRGDARVVDDTAVTPELASSANLVLWGDPSSNRVIKKILPNLPLAWDSRGLKLGTGNYPTASTIPILIYPNPFNPHRYVVLNSSFTFRQGSNASNATQTPKLPDWAVVDLRTPPDDKAPGLVMDAGFFNERWSP